MYFNNSGEAANNYVSKIKKYANKGIILKANNDDSNYGVIKVDSANVKKLGDNNGVVYLGLASLKSLASFLIALSSCLAVLK